MSKTVRVDATPGVEPSEPDTHSPLPADTSTLRLIHGRYTLDLLPRLVDGERLPVFASTGELGTPPTVVAFPIGLAPALVEAATVVRERRVIDTAAWTSLLIGRLAKPLFLIADL